MKCRRCQHEAHAAQCEHPDGCWCDTFTLDGDPPGLFDDERPARAEQLALVTTGRVLKGQRAFDFGGDDR